MDLDAPNETDSLQPLRQVMGQSGAVMAFLALRADDGSFAIRAVAEPSSENPWTEGALQSWAQSAWDDPLLRHGSIIVCVDALPGDGSDSSTPFTVAAAPLVDAGQPDTMRGLLCIINSANAPFSQQQVDNLAEGARWFNMNPALAESVFQGGSGDSTSVDESPEVTVDSVLDAAVDSVLDAAAAPGTLGPSDGAWLSSLVGEDPLTKVPGPVPFLRAVGDTFQGLNDESELSIFLVNITPASGGAEVSELLLVGIAGRLRSELRTADLVGRIGPATFAAMVVTPIGLLAASSIAHRLHGAIEEVVGDVPGEIVTRSSIATQNAQGDRNTEELFRHAVDRLLA